MAKYSRIEADLTQVSLIMSRVKQELRQAKSEEPSQAVQLRILGWLKTAQEVAGIIASLEDSIEDLAGKEEE